MRILFIRDACRVSYRLRNELRARGHDADVLVFRPQAGEVLDPEWAIGRRCCWDAMRIPTDQPDALRPDWFLDDRQWRGVLRAKKWWMVARLARRYDVVVWATGPSWWARLVHVGGPRMVAHFHGSELTSGRATIPSQATILVSTPNLLPLVPNGRATLLPNPIELLSPAEPKVEGTMRIGHYPSHPATKGTPKIRTALKALQEEHPKLEFDIATGIPHDVVLERMRRCDLIIDQHTDLGAHGVVALEAMSMQKVVLCSIRDEWYPDCPIISTRPGLDEALREAIAVRQQWKAIGAAGRRYVAARHSQKQGADILLEALG